jgi:hypothetical protein
MHISLEFLKPTDCSFYGIVPGSANYPLSQIALDVCFGNRLNYRRENLEFKVMDWPSQYHAILGRPTFSRFMAVPHYTYMVLKLPGPNRIITVKGSFELSDICDKEFHKMTQSFGTTAEYGESKGRAEQYIIYSNSINAEKNHRRHSRSKETWTLLPGGAAREQGCAAALLACNCQIMWADVIKDSFKFEFLKSFISQTVDPIDNPFSLLAYSR